MTTSPKATLLTEEDRLVIRNIGAPYPPREDLVQLDSRGIATFTAKGLEFYKAAAAGVGMPVDMGSLKDDDALFTFTQQILWTKRNRLMDGLQHDLASGSVALNRRDIAQAILSGNWRQALRAFMHTEKFFNAPDNVIPCSFPKKRKRSTP